MKQKGLLFTIFKKDNYQFHNKVAQVFEPFFLLHRITQKDLSFLSPSS